MPPFKERFYALIYSLDRGRVAFLLSYIAFSNIYIYIYGNKFLKNKAFTFKGKIWSREKLSTSWPGLCPSFLPLLCPASFRFSYRLAPLPRENGTTLNELGFVSFIH